MYVDNHGRDNLSEFAQINESKALITNIPTIIIHGSEDEVVPVDHAYKLYDSINAPRELHIIEGADHSLTNFSHRNEAINLITQWMLKYL